MRFTCAIHLPLHGATRTVSAAVFSQNDVHVKKKPVSGMMFGAQGMQQSAQAAKKLCTLAQNFFHFGAKKEKMHNISLSMMLEANGSVKSILDWAQKAGLDHQQRRAFEIFAGTFVLSFF